MTGFEKRVQYHTEKYKRLTKILLSLLTQEEREQLNMMAVMSVLKSRLKGIERGLLHALVDALRKIVYHRTLVADMFQGKYESDLKRGEDGASLLCLADDLVGHQFAILRYEEILNEAEMILRSQDDSCQTLDDISRNSNRVHANRFSELDIGADAHDSDTEDSFHIAVLPSTQHSTSQNEGWERILVEHKRDKDNFDEWIFDLSNWLQSISEVIVVASRIHTIDQPVATAPVLAYIWVKINVLLGAPRLYDRMSWVSQRFLTRNSHPFAEYLCTAMRYLALQDDHVDAESPETGRIFTTKSKKPTKGQRRNKKLARIRRMIEESRHIIQCSKKHDLDCHGTLGVMESMIEVIDEFAKEPRQEMKNYHIFCFAVALCYIHEFEKSWGIQSGSKKYNQLRDAMRTNFYYYSAVINRYWEFVQNSDLVIKGLQEMAPMVDELNEPVVMFLLCSAIDTSLQQTMEFLLSTGLIYFTVWLYTYYSLAQPHDPSDTERDPDSKTQYPRCIDTKRELDVFCERYKHFLFCGMRPESTQELNTLYLAWAFKTLLSKPSQYASSLKTFSTASKANGFKMVDDVVRRLQGISNDEQGSMSPTQHFATGNVDTIILFEDILRVVEDHLSKEDPRNNKQPDRLTDRSDRACAYIASLVLSPEKSKWLIDMLLQNWHTYTSNNRFATRKQYVADFGAKDV